MFTARSGRGMPRLAAVIVTAAGCWALAVPSAWSAPPAHRATHFAADHAGSTVAAHEGRPAGGVSAAMAGVDGMDVSSYQGDVDWPTAAANGAQFAYVKATEGTDYTNPSFAQQYEGSYYAGMIRGAYHFALPDWSSGAYQADFFVDNGGGWSADGQTLPPALDIEYNPYGATCYGLSQDEMVSWIWDFVSEVQWRTGRYPTIYTTTDWWRTCTGDYSGFAAYDPLWIARYAGDAGTLPAGWDYYTFWQYADSGVFPGDQDTFNGGYDRLQALAYG